MADWNAGIIEEFRSNNGIVGGMFEGKPLLILHSTGAKTGQTRVNPLMYHEGDDTIHIFASKAGAPTHPDWYYNLKANPDVEIEIGTETRSVRATEVTGAERDRIFQSMASRFPQFGEYQEGNDRTIPVFALTPRS